MQSNQRCVFVGSGGGLVQPLAIQGECPVALGEPGGGSHNVAFRNSAHTGCQLGRVINQAFGHCVEAFCVFVDVGHVKPTVLYHHVQHGIEQHHIGAGLNFQMQISHERGVGCAGVDHNQFVTGLGSARSFKPAVSHWVRIRHVGTGDKHAIGQGQIVVVARWRISTQRAFVTAHSAAHAQA